ncbi:class I SAM-dependent methyltransferase [Rhodopila sp.]|uniref:class I SAM-dependent methyltransferase n=1 Tax=Rhodopila sp. TaxID=2480087 RepID=UPI003D111AA4
MSNSLSRLATHAAYGASQLPRLAWYVGHGVAMRRLSQVARVQQNESKRPRARTSKPVPDRRRLLADMAILLRQDVANINAGLYPFPIDHDGSLWTRLDRSRLFFADLPEIHRRRENGMSSEVLSPQFLGKRPRYYLQNFHFQSGGWMTDESAQRYDTQVEVFFSGTANAMRRQALPALREAFAERDQRGLRLLDVGCGTGRFLDSIKQTWPRLRITGLDLSEAYIREAKSHLRRWSHTDLLVANTEAIPLPDASLDAVTSTFLFHELPPKARRNAFAEFARVLKPGGRLIVLDSLQSGDDPDYEGTLELFPQNFHEPYFTSYTKENFPELSQDVGLAYRRDVRAFVSKVMVFDKPSS